MLSYTERPNRVLIASRPREAFLVGELEYAVAAGHYLGLGLERARAWDEQAAAYRTLVDWATSGKLKVEFEVLPLEAAPVAWKRQASSPHRKLALSPQARG